MIKRKSSTIPTDRTYGASETKLLPLHSESTRSVTASAEAVFSHLDDHNRLAGHMNQSSWLLAGSRMAIELDAAKGRATKSHIHIRGRVLGIPLHVEEVVTEYQPPFRKAWETIGVPKLLVIGHYKMGFEITSQGASSLLLVFIDYDLPEPWLTRLLGQLLGSFYARWCTESMAKDAAAYFSPSEPQLR